MPWIDDFAMLT